MAKFINKNGKISKTAYDRIIGFTKQKLSNLYSSRSTRYHSIYDSELFVIARNKEAIMAAGYSPLCKAIIDLNYENETVQTILKMEKERTEKIEAEKNAIREAIQNEAKSIIIDDEFKTALKWASEVTGVEKSDRMASAMKGLLSRNNKEEIVTDFWQVFRILKAAAEK